MSENKEKERKLATNRLLDILRSQQEVEAKEDDSSLKDDQERKIDEEIVQEDKNVKQEATPVNEDIIQSVTMKHQTLVKEENEPEQTVIDKKIIKPVKEKETQKRFTVEEVPSSTNTILEHLQTNKPIERKKGPEIDPEEFDSTLLSESFNKEKQSTFQSIIDQVYNKINLATHQITLHRQMQKLHFMEIQKTGKGIVVKEFKKFELPFATGERTITEMDDLVAYILNTQGQQKGSNHIYGSYVGSELLTRTKSIETPKLKQNEIRDLVKWTAKKNLPFDADEANLDWHIFPSHNNSEKRQVLIGVCDNKGLQKDIKEFESNGIPIRYVSTIPILMWKLFVRNYPDSKNDCVILVYIGDKELMISLVDKHRLLFSREISLGMDDFTNAIMQRIVEGNDTIRIDKDMALKIMSEYGFPDTTSGVVKGTNIRLYKLSIFLRPVIEKLSSEIRRSLSFFKKENPTLNWNEILFMGEGVSYPNIVKTLGKNLTVECRILNPNRTFDFQFNGDKVMQENQLSAFALNYALALTDKPLINVVPPNQQQENKFIFLSNFSKIVSVFLIPLFILTTILSYTNSVSLEQQLSTRQNTWDDLSDGLKDYFSMVKDIEIWNAYRQYLKNDQTYSQNQLTLLKLISNIVPPDVKLTSLEFKRELEDPNENSSGIGISKTINKMHLNGFVQAHAAIADIQLTNFIIQIENLPVFKKIESELEKSSDPNNKLFFTLKLYF